MIRIPVAHMRIAARTHPGMSGKKNEDNFAVAAFKLEKHRPVTSVFAVVSDGIGGHRAGEVAAELAVETISRVVADSDAAHPVNILTRAVAQANYAIVSQASQTRGQYGMGATCVCAWVIGDRLYTASVGDSRLYWMRNGVIQQLTTDHTWVHEAVERGIIQPEEARSHPNAHVIRRYLGSDPAPQPDFRLRWQPDDSDQRARNQQGHRLMPGDVLLLCSDGLTDLVGDAEIAGIVARASSLDDAADALVALANQRGGHDNITVVLLELVGQSPTVPVPARSLPTAQPAASQTDSPSWEPLWILGGVVILALLLVLTFSILWAVGWLHGPPLLTPTPLP